MYHFVMCGIYCIKDHFIFAHHFTAKHLMCVLLIKQYEYFCIDNHISFHVFMYFVDEISIANCLTDICILH